MLSVHEHSEGIVFKVILQPRSSKNTIVGLQADCLKIKVVAPPVDGAANKRCIQLLAKCLRVPRTSLRMISGHNSRTKHILFVADRTSGTAEQSARFRQRLEKLARY